MSKRTLTVMLVVSLLVLGRLSLRRASPFRSPDRSNKSSEHAAAETRAEVAAAGHVAATANAASCDHPFIPSRVGAWRKYTVQQWTKAEKTGERTVEYRVIEAQQRGAGTWHVTWKVTVEPTSFGAGDGRSTQVERNCWPDGGSEDPWSGSLGIVVERSEGNLWRWPRDLAIGATFSGHVDEYPQNGGRSGVPKRITLEQQHFVEARETIKVPAGEFDVFRVRLDGIHDFETKKPVVSGQLWIARGIGMVESSIQLENTITKAILLAYGG